MIGQIQTKLSFFLVVSGCVGGLHRKRVIVVVIVVVCEIKDAYRGHGGGAGGCLAENARNDGKGMVAR